MEITVHKASAIRDSVPDLVITANAAMPEIVHPSSPGWELLARDRYEQEGRLVAEALWQHLPGGTVDQILMALLERRASLLRVRHNDVGVR